MRRSILVAALLVLAVLVGLLVGLDGRSDEKKPSGLEKRIPWTTSKVVGSPDPPSPYRLETAFPKLKFDEPLDIVGHPQVPRLFVTERFGRVFSFPTDPQVEKADLLLDLNEVHGRKERGISSYGFALHPKFKDNSYVYVTYVLEPGKEQSDGTRVSRFKVLPGNPPKADPKSEQILIQWQSGGHNGGCLMFGPDGYLYIATGDASGIADSALTGQDLTTLAGKILRIDVDKPDAGKACGIPKDNPFVDTKDAKPEIWAYGLRQPWKMSFDSKTGDFWAGNVGQDLWEQIYLIERGGNYGWSIMEGSHPFRPERKRGPSQIIMPTVEHDHANFRSITGGYVYHGSRLKELQGAYIYGDYDTGRIWMFRYDRQKKAVTENRELVDSTLRLICFAEDSAGEVYLLDHIGGRISKLVPNPAAGTTAPFPRKLSETGLFSSTKDLQPAPGLIPYSVIAPQWADGATAERFLALPGESKLEFETMTYPGAPGAPPGWKFPNGGVAVQTLFLEMDSGDPKSRRRLETRILHHERLTGGEEIGDQYWQGYTYVWNDEQTDAVLLEDPMGADRVFTIRDRKAPDGKRQQTWHYPSRAECTVCHNMAAKYALGVQTPQMNRDHDYGGVTANQLKTFEHIGLFANKLPTPPEEMPRLTDYRDTKQDLNLRARSYLHANCGHCHRKWGGGNGEFQLLATFDLPDMGILGVRPGHGTFNIPNARLLTAHDPYRSVLFYRMAKLGPGRMPRIGSNEVDEAGVQLIHDWIAQLPATGMVTDASLRGGPLETLRTAKVGDELNQRLDPMLASPPLALRLMSALGSESFPAPLRNAVVARATRPEAGEIRDLFERFLPEEKRVKRLGDVIRPEQILAMPGDAGRGRKLFLETTGMQCRNCHRVAGQGIEVGPDLDQIGKKYDRAQILDQIFNPSKLIDPKYLTYHIETKQGRLVTGLLVSRDAKKIVLKNAENKQIEVAADDVDQLVIQQKSLMPDLLLRDLTAEQVADLTAFLSSLK